VYAAVGFVVMPVTVTAQQLEASKGLQALQEESLQIYNLIVSPASESEATEEKVITELPCWGSGESVTEEIVGGWPAKPQMLSEQ
jgi:hypothetical protein